MSARDHSCEVCGGGGLNSPPAPDCSCGSSWMDRVEQRIRYIDASSEDDGLDLRDLARQMAERLDALAERKTDDEVIVTGTGASVQRVWEDAEVGRLLRELAADGSSEVGVYRHGDSWIAWRDPRAWESSTRDASGPTRLAALRALAEAVKE